MLYKNRYRIESTRLKGWNYRSSGAYFITICTHNRFHYFGKCHNGQMQLSTIGLIVQGCWFEIPRFNPQVQLGAFIVMPNHIHGILILDEVGNAPVETLQCNVSTKQQCNTPTKQQCNVSTKQQCNTPTKQQCNTPTKQQCNVSTKQQCNTPTKQPIKKSKFHQKITPKPGSVSTIIRSFKSASTKHNNKTFPDTGFKWQARFHDHIIRNEQSYHRISNYINNNPKAWKEDRFY